MAEKYLFDDIAADSIFPSAHLKGYNTSGPYRCGVERLRYRPTSSSLTSRHIYGKGIGALGCNNRELMEWVKGKNNREQFEKDDSEDSGFMTPGTESLPLTKKPTLDLENILPQMASLKLASSKVTGNSAIGSSKSKSSSENSSSNLKEFGKSDTEDSGFVTTESKLPLAENPTLEMENICTAMASLKLSEGTDNSGIGSSKSEYPSSNPKIIKRAMDLVLEKYELRQIQLKLERKQKHKDDKKLRSLMKGASESASERYRKERWNPQKSVFVRNSGEVVALLTAVEYEKKVLEQRGLTRGSKLRGYEDCQNRHSREQWF